jgi:4-hydroxybenzoate-CoA ligase
VFETLRSHQAAMFYAVPTLYAAILADPNCVLEMRSSRLRLCFSVGEPLPAHIGQSWKACFGLDIVNGVGSSEMGHLFLTNKPDAVDYNASGVAVNGYDLKLVDEAGREVADGEFGELLVRGPSAAAGYWNQRERTRCIFQGEWIRTGDMFKVSGIWVSPFEVEAALVSHPSVLEAAVVAAEDTSGLTKPKASSCSSRMPAIAVVARSTRI